MLRRLLQVARLVVRPSTGALDVAGFCCLVAAAGVAFGLAPALAVAGVSLIVVRYLAE